MSSLPSSSSDSSPALSGPAKPLIVVLGTGGTIAGVGADATQTTRYQAGALSVQALLDTVPMLDTIARIESEQLANIDSKDMTVALWLALARRITQLLALDEVDGVVLTHGTDTLEETAYWLHLSVDSEKPVVLTGAMRPATALSADGPSNLFNAVVVAADAAARNQGVLVVFGQRIHSAREVTKTSTYALDAFASPDLGLLGWVRGTQASFERHATRAHTAASEFAIRGDGPQTLPAVEIVTSYAGASAAGVDALVAAGVRGIVVAGTGNGSIHDSLQQALCRAVAHGVAVVRASRVGAGPVEPNDAAQDDALGFVAAGSLNPYKARVLLMLALTTGDVSPPRLSRFFATY